MCPQLKTEQTLEQFFLTVGQNNFGNKIPFFTSAKLSLVYVLLRFTLGQIWASPENGLTVRVACWSSSRMTRVVTMRYKFLSCEMSHVTHVLGRTSVDLLIEFYW